MQKASEEFIVRAQGSIQKVDLKAREAEQAKTSTFEKTLFLVREGKSIEEIGIARGLTQETVISHLEKLLMIGLLSKEKAEYLMPKGKKFREILSAFQEIYDRTGELQLTPVKNKIPGSSYKDIQLARVFLNR
jgi:DNA-binding CsgD family transcriptional regulator